MKNTIKVTIDVKKIETLAGIYEAACAGFEPENEHEHLLFEHVKLMHVKLFDKLRLEQNKYTLTLTSVEALAFVQFWQIIPLALAPYHATIINRLFGEIDKKVKQPKLYAAK